MEKCTSGVLHFVAYGFWCVIFQARGILRYSSLAPLSLIPELEPGLIARPINDSMVSQG